MFLLVFFPNEYFFLFYNLHSICILYINLKITFNYFFKNLYSEFNKKNYKIINKI